MNKGYVEYLEKHYGMKCMGLEEELALSESERSIRNCKTEIIDTCKWMKNYIGSIENRAREIRVDDNLNHAEMVRRFENLVIRAEIGLLNAALYGGRDVV